MYTSCWNVLVDERSLVELKVNEPFYFDELQFYRTVISYFYVKALFRRRKERINIKQK